MKTLSLLFILTIAAGAADLRIDTINLAQEPLTNRAVTITFRGPAGVYNGKFVGRDPVLRTTDSQGVAWRSNIITGLAYDLTLGGTYSTPFVIFIPTNAVGTVNASECVTTNNFTGQPGAAWDARYLLTSTWTNWTATNVFGGGPTNGQTAAQVAAQIAATNPVTFPYFANWENTNLYASKTLVTNLANSAAQSSSNAAIAWVTSQNYGAGGGTTYSNSTGGPGIIAGGTIGTNLTMLVLATNGTATKLNLTSTNLHILNQAGGRGLLMDMNSDRALFRDNFSQFWDWDSDWRIGYVDGSSNRIETISIDPDTGLIRTLGDIYAGNFYSTNGAGVTNFAVKAGIVEAASYKGDGSLLTGLTSGVSSNSVTNIVASLILATNPVLQPQLNTASNDLRNAINAGGAPVNVTNVAPSQYLKFINFEQRPNGAYDPATDGFILCRAPGYEWATNGFILTNGAMRSVILTNGVQMPAQYLCYSNFPALTEMRVHAVFTPYGMNGSSNQASRNVVLILSASPNNNGSNFLIGNWTLHAQYNYDYNHLSVVADLWTNGISSTYRGEEAQGRSGSISWQIFGDPNTSRPVRHGEEMNMGFERVARNQVMLFMGGSAVVWTLDAFTNLFDCAQWGGPKGTNWAIWEVIGGGTNQYGSFDWKSVSMSTTPRTWFPPGIEPRYGYYQGNGVLLTNGPTLFTGRFVGDGSELTGLPASAVTNLGSAATLAASAFQPATAALSNYNATAFQPATAALSNYTASAFQPATAALSNYTASAFQPATAALSNYTASAFQPATAALTNLSVNNGAALTNLPLPALVNSNYQANYVVDFTFGRKFAVTNVLAGALTVLLTNCSSGWATIDLQGGTTNYNITVTLPAYATGYWLSPTNGSPTVVSSSNKWLRIAVDVNTTGNKTNLVMWSKEQP